MPRGPRLDCTGALHHVMVRGIERRAIFVSQDDRAEFLRRLGKIFVETKTRAYAWALMPNHAHILVLTGILVYYLIRKVKKYVR